MRAIKDRLAHLTFSRACHLLGPEGESPLRRGGKFDVDIDRLSIAPRGRTREAARTRRTLYAPQDDHVKAFQTLPHTSA
jgi:hypothetical protein